jgi:hypothetical protein
MDPHIEDLNGNTDANVATAVMLSGTAALRGALLNKRARWEDALVPNVIRRLKGPARVRELQARAVVSAALACLNTAVDEWARSGGTKPLDKLLDSAIDAVRS